MLEQKKEILDPLAAGMVLLGHAGSGKTSIAVTLAQMLAGAGSDVTLIDLDVVNPYFRSGDHQDALEQAGVSLLLPQFSGATNNLEVPSLPPQIDQTISQAGTLDAQHRPRRVLLDVGGDDLGARVLGRYAESLLQRPFGCYYVQNPYRYQTASTAAVRENIQEIEQAATLKVTGIIGNPNLGQQTTPDLIAAARTDLETLSEALALPLVLCAVDQRFAASFPDALPLSISHPMPAP